MTVSELFLTCILDKLLIRLSIDKTETKDITESMRLQTLPQFQQQNGQLEQNTGSLYSHVHIHQKQ